MNVHEAFEYLENLDVSSEDDSRAIWIVLPPNDNCYRDTNKD